MANNSTVSSLKTASPLKWVLIRPWSSPSRVLALLLLSLAIAPLRVATIAALLPVLQLLLHDDGPQRLRAAAANASPWLEVWAAPLVDFATQGSALQALAWTLGGVLFLAALRGILQVIQVGIAARLVHAAAAEIAIEVHESVLRGSGDDSPEGEILTHFSTDLDAVRAALRRVYLRVLREPFHLLATLAFLLWMDWRLALWSGVAFPAGAAALWFFSRRLKRASRRALERTGNVLAVAEEGLRGRREVRSYGLEGRERSRFADSVHHLRDQLIHLDRQESLSSPLLELLCLLAAIVCSLFGLRQVLNGSLNSASFLTFYAVLLSALDPLRKLADTQIRIQRGAAAAQRLLDRVRRGEGPAPVCGAQGWPTKPVTVEVHAARVLNHEGVAVLADLDLRIPPGQTVLLAGASGAGKSTLLDLLAGLRSPDRGHLSLGGVPIAELDPHPFRREVTLVPSQSFLFRGSLRDNLLLGDPAPTAARLQQALRMADLEARIGQLPRGLDTKVQDVPFSAGERQRIGLARAFLRDPEILLLDEATSALDRPREESILTELLRLRAGRINLLVTHRLGTRIPVDRVLVLENGHWVADGTPEELQRNSTAYRVLADGVAPDNISAEGTA